jgi:glycosyltransferase involved in cell wall biosynthesis
MNILFVHAGAEMYGADRVLLELAGGLVERGHRCHVVLPSDGPLKPALQAAGVAVDVKNLGVLRRKYFSVRGLFNRLLRLVRAVLFLRQLIRREGVDVVHSNTTAVFAGALAARLCGVAHVWHVHEITTRPRWFVVMVASLLRRLSDRVVFVSDATRAHLCGINPGLQPLSVTVYNGIDTSRATSGQRGVLRRAHGWADDTLVVGMIGRINWWKGQDKLLDAAQLLLPRHPELRFLLVGGVFVGEEPLRDALLARAANVGGTTAAVAVEDFRDDIANVLADIDIYVLPSTEPDPFPTVVLEAMAAGKAIVAFRHGGVCEMVADGVSGLLCTPVSQEELAAAITSLVADGALRKRLGAGASQRVAERFTRAAFLSNFEQIYRAVARKVRP